MTEQAIKEMKALFKEAITKEEAEAFIKRLDAGESFEVISRECVALIAVRKADAVRQHMMMHFGKMPNSYVH